MADIVLLPLPPCVDCGSVTDDVTAILDGGAVTGTIYAYSRDDWGDLSPCDCTPPLRDPHPC